MYYLYQTNTTNLEDFLGLLIPIITYNQIFLFAIFLKVLMWFNKFIGYVSGLNNFWCFGQILNYSFYSTSEQLNPK